jgi:hypothetical protein
MFPDLPYTRPFASLALSRLCLHSSRPIEAHPLEMPAMAL